jgi:hypothetical protein
MKKEIWSKKSKIKLNFLVVSLLSIVKVYLNGRVECDKKICKGPKNSK